MMYRLEEVRKANMGLIVVTLIVLLLMVVGVYLLLFNKPFASDPSATGRTLVSVNLREGPGIVYPKSGGLPAGTEVTAVGRNEDGSWLLIETDSGTMWMTGKSDYVEMDAEDLAALPVVQSPPPAYDVSSPSVHQLLNFIPLVVHHRDHFTCASHAGLNNLLPSVVSGNVIGPHSGDFVLIGKENVLFEYADGTFRLIRDNPIARFDGGEKYLPLEKAIKMFETGEIVWTGRFGDWPGRGVPGCDESSKPD